MKHAAALLLLLLTILTGICQPAQIIVIRHAEKPDDPQALHLSKKGEARAKSLVEFLTKDPHAIKHGLPTVLLASRPTHKGTGQRPRETLQPLATQLQLEIEIPFESKDYAQLARQVLTTPQYSGKTVVICWVHEHLPALAAALGVTPEPSKWKDADYNSAYVISYPEGKAHLKVVSQNLK